MERSARLVLALLAACCFLALFQPARAAIIAEGDVQPDPEAIPCPWDSYTTGYVGKTTDGSLMVNDGSSIDSYSCSIAYNSGVVGQVTVTGSDSTGNIASTWDNSDDLYVGYWGAAILAITNGGKVSISSDYNASYVGYASSATGRVTVSGAGSMWTNSRILLYIGYGGGGTLAITGGGTVTNDGESYIGRLSDSVGEVTVSGLHSTWSNSVGLAIGEDGSGTLTITDGGKVSGGWGRLGYSSDSAGQVTICGSGSAWTNSGGLVVGFGGNGTLAITDGATVGNTMGRIGYSSSSTGGVAVSGGGSTWTNDDNLYIGSSGSGTLVITGGGTVENDWGFVGALAGSTGKVTVSGADTTWTNSGKLYIGDSGSGTLAITDGAKAMASDVSVNSQSLLAIEVSDGSRLTLGSSAGTITNSGKVRIIAGASATTGQTCTPILAGTWSGSGVYQAVGGRWNTTGHTFVPSAVLEGNSGIPVSVDLASVQRVLIDDLTTGWAVGASFLKKTGSPALAFTATVAGTAELGQLEGLLDNGEVVRGAWQFTATGGYTAGEPAYLSFDIVPGDERERLAVWYYNGTAWSAYDAWDLTCDGTYASFTVTGFSGYAVVAALVPGDTDGNNVVDEGDAATLAAHWGQAGDWADGDFDGDGVVGAADASLLAANWGYGTTSGEGGSVPEAGTLAMLLGLGAMTVARRRRRE